jgi:hypothetical protein
MTLGVSNLSGANGAFAGSGLSDNGAMAAQNFLNALLGQGDAPKSGGEAFFADVKDAKGPNEKRALIDGFAEGFAAASQGAGGSHGTDGAETAASGGTQASDGAAQAGGADEGAEPGSPQELMQGFQEIADKVADSDLPKGAKNKLLDGIADLMSKLKAEDQGCHAAGPEASAQTDAAPQADAAPQSQGSDGAGAPETSGTRAATAQDSGSSANANDGVWTHEVKDGEATIRLGDRYTIKANEKDASWTVTNNETGKTAKISGDPHVDSNGDGKNDFDFKKDMTFKLDDGTKITVGTVPGGKDGATYSSQLTITNGENAIQVSGLGDKYDGENNLEVKQSMEGNVIDNLTNDGSNTVHENGGAWQTGGGNAVDQAYIERAEKVFG